MQKLSPCPYSTYPYLLSHTFSSLYFNFTAYSGRRHKFHQSPCPPSQSHPTLTRLNKLEFDCSGGKYHSPEDGYSLTVPKGAISEKLGSVSIQCGVIPYGPFGPFKYPDDIKPVSPIVWFCSTPSVKFQKPVEITIPHCLDCEEDSQSLAFFKANHNVSNSGPIARVFHFKEVEGTSSFPTNTSHGILQSKHLCFYCIGSKDKEITNKAKFCLITAKPVCFQRRSRIHFCLTYLLETCIKVSIPIPGTHSVYVLGLPAIQFLITKIKTWIVGRSVSEATQGLCCMLLASEHFVIQLNIIFPDSDYLLHYKPKSISRIITHPLSVVEDPLD